MQLNKQVKKEGALLCGEEKASLAHAEVRTVQVCTASCLRWNKAVQVWGNFLISAISGPREQAVHNQMREALCSGVSLPSAAVEEKPDFLRYRLACMGRD